MARQATLLVADEIFYNLHGKAVLQGIYHSDLIITTNPTTVSQLIFFFIMETELSDPFRSLAVEVVLPGNVPVRNQVPVTYPIPSGLIREGTTRLFYRHPMLVPSPILRPGRIEAKAVHDSGEITVGAPWIIPVQSPPTTN
jgi:hypothetical protein